MPIMMAAAASHAPSLFQQEYRGWQWFYDKVKQGHPQPPETELENEELIAERVPRIQENFARLKREITAFDPDVIIAVLGDQREWFDGSNIPNVLVYSGPDEWTAHNTGAWDRDPAVDPWTSEEHRYTLPIDRELARSLSQGLVDEGFDAAWSTQMRQLAKPSCGFPHSIGFVAPHTHPSLSTPVVPVFVNVENGPPVILHGERCVALGRAVAKICESSDKPLYEVATHGQVVAVERRNARGWAGAPRLACQIPCQLTRRSAQMAAITVPSSSSVSLGVYLPANAQTT